MNLNPMRSVADQVLALRNMPVEGSIVDLVPYSHDHHDAIIALRNTERASYFLLQREPLTVEKQTRWFDGVLARRDDVQWTIMRKDGVIVGATALYGIAEDRSRAEKGRLVIDESRSREAPYTLEAELLLLDIAFGMFGIQRVETSVRHDNGVMQSINTRLGFVHTHSHDNSGVEYYLSSLSADQYQPAALRAVVDAWARRAQRPTRNANSPADSAITLAR
ncbi:MAG TPA: GNAT family N-acetyltransferase [Gemmatimonas sp.]|uniref:GNAT family N-acetyltransferase n=1 Tax=Gemmatimonas sp. TaxID=1962908 RepID=UPI002EDB38A6